MSMILKQLSLAILIVCIGNIGKVFNSDTPSADSSLDNQVPYAECGGTFTAANGSFMTPNYPAANNLLDCSWIIQVATTHQIRLVIFNFDTEKDADFYMIHDGGTTLDPILQIASGSAVPVPIRSSGNKILVRFVTNNKVVSRGFEANYFSVPPCFYILDGTVNGSFSSPFYPNNYDHNLNCEWLIDANRTQRISIQFSEVFTEQDYDYIQIHDGPNDTAPVLRRLSGNITTPVEIQSSSNALLVRFYSDTYLTNKGFSATYYPINTTEYKI